jgi:hypothetical protein
MSNQPELKVSKELDAAIAACTNPAELRDIMVQQLQREGQVVATTDSDFKQRVALNPSAAPALPLPASGFKYSRSVRWAESTGKRPVTISANTMEELEALYVQITS